MHVRNRQVGGMRAWERHKLLPYYHIKCWAIYISQLAPKIPVLWPAKLASIIFQTISVTQDWTFLWQVKQFHWFQGKKTPKNRREPFISGTSEPNQYLPAVLTHAYLGTALLKSELAALALLDLPLLHLLTINSLLLFHYQDSVVPPWAVLPITWIDKSPFLYFYI